MKEIFRSKEFKITVIGGVTVLFLWAIITVIYAKITNINYLDALVSTWNILNIKLNIFWFVIFILTTLFYIKWYLNRLEKRIEAKFFTKEEVTIGLKTKLNESTFERFEDVYDYRRLKNHPWHSLYTDSDDNIKSFKYMLWLGKYKKDYYKTDNAIAGLIAEIKERGWIGNSIKSEIINELSDCYKDKYDAKKEELLNLLNTIETI